MMVVMPVAVPYLEAVEAINAAAKHGKHFLAFVDVSHSDYAYWDLFARLWDGGEPFVLVEHDIVVRPDTIDLLAACPEPWCGFVYHEAPGDPVAGLGCTKITPTGDVVAGLLHPLVWQNVDSAATGLLTGAGLKRHDHHPWLRHLNPAVADCQQKVEE